MIPFYSNWLAKRVRAVNLSRTGRTAPPASDPGPDYAAMARAEYRARKSEARYNRQTQEIEGKLQRKWLRDKSTKQRERDYAYLNDVFSGALEERVRKSHPPDSCEPLLNRVDERVRDIAQKHGIDLKAYASQQYPFRHHGVEKEQPSQSRRRGSAPSFELMDIPKFLVVMPLWVLCYSSLFVSLAYIVSTAYRLWPAWVRIAGSSEVWIGIGILLGPVVVAAFLTGALAGRFLSRASGIRQDLLTLLSMCIPILLCLPIAVDAWWHDMPTFTSLIRFPTQLLRVLPASAAGLLAVDLPRAYSLLIVTGGWAYFLGTFIPYIG